MPESPRIDMHIYGDKNWVCYNPHEKPIKDLPVIIGFNNGGSGGMLFAVSIAQDGTVLGEHCCSHELYMPGDLGVIAGHRLDRHEQHYQKHYPDGYRMEFYGYNEASDNKLLMAALTLNADRARAKAEQDEKAAKASKKAQSKPNRARVK